MYISMVLDMNFALSVLSICIASIGFALFMKLYLKYTSKFETYKSIPEGKMGLPWIGETIDFYKAQKNNKIFEEFVHPRIAKHGKIFKTKLMGSPTIVVNGAEANKFFMSNEFKLVISSWPSSSVQLMGKDSIMEKQGEAHRFLRGLITSTLNISGQEILVPKICDTVQCHLEKYWKGQENIRIYPLAKKLTFTIVFECLLGLEVHNGILCVFKKVLEGVFAPPINVPGSKFYRAKSARKELNRLIVSAVREKKRELEEEEKESGTLFSRLVLAMINGEITEDEVVDNVILLVFGAHDTTSFVIAMMFHMLGRYPDCYSRLLQEHNQIRSKKKPGERLSYEDTKKMSYTWQVARESMRMFPPIFGSFRKAVVDIEYEGFTIPQGWKVLWTTYGTHLNEEYFEDPETFNPSRFDKPVQSYSFIPFGGGPRLCAGYQLARLNILTLVHYVVTQYEWSLIYPDENVVMDPLPFPSQGMPIRISPKV
ncbi:hypothetical protein Leryth_022511 [Lithospermum erythrorhizon]|uniref:Oxygenase n=1 Tax=Lithospermum erythrorhizon TaxID=34254 RepID=A0AAV3S0W7_LITER|nr:hypothetical protein Leryth_022511 [Lithospermum erythrorhizon]